MPRILTLARNAFLLMMLMIGPVYGASFRDRRPGQDCPRGGPGMRTPHDARLGTGYGRAYIGYNRRRVYPDGTVTMFCRAALRGSVSQDN